MQQDIRKMIPVVVKPVEGKISQIGDILQRTVKNITGNGKITGKNPENIARIADQGVIYHQGKIIPDEIHP